MAKSNTCWKIRDTVTGLFWSGDKTGCSHQIGTRFHTQNLLHDTVQRISRDKRNYPKGFPTHWEVLEVELSETVSWTMTGQSALVDASLANNFQEIIDGRFDFAYGQKTAGVNVFLQLRRNSEFGVWPYMGLRRHKYQQSWKLFVNELAPLGILEKDMARRGQGWVLFADKNVAAAARLADTLKGVVEINELRIAFARKYGFKTEEI